VKVGAGSPLVSSPADAALMADAERLGFDYLACGEHMMFHVPARNTFITLACAHGVDEHRVDAEQRPADRGQQVGSPAAPVADAVVDERTAIRRGSG
jgi:hypothetical protein